MKKTLQYLFSLSLFLTLITNNGFSQNISCGTKEPSITEIEQTQAFIKNYQSNSKNLRPSAETIYIPIKLHVVIPDDGNLNLSFFKSKDFNQALAYTNTLYKKINIQFYVTGNINYIKSSKFLNFDFKSSNFVLVDGQAEQADEQELCKPYDLPNAINIYVINTLQLNGAFILGYAKLPNPTSVALSSTNRIMTSGLGFYGYGNLRHVTLSHELGHFFSLHHPFDAVGGKELVTRGTGANCSTAGDLLCDTPADPHLGLEEAKTEGSGCKPYTGVGKDANGDLYVPDITNIMSYYTCRTSFTTGQYERMLAGFALRKTNATFGKFDAPDTQVNAPTITGINAYNGGANYLFFTDNSNNETGYIIERATSPNGDFVAIGGVGENARNYSDEFSDIDKSPASTYYYRIRPSNSKTAYSNVFSANAKEKTFCIPPVNVKCGEISNNLIFRNIKANGTNLNESFVPCNNPFNYLFSLKTINFQANTDYTIEGTVENSQVYRNVYAWIDKNRNGIFDADEILFSTNFDAINRPPNTGFSFPFVTKDLAGTYIIRLRLAFATSLQDACTGVVHGETIDYSINILGAYTVKAGPLSITNYCPNASISVPFTSDGTPAANTTYLLQISDNLGNNFKALPTTVEGTNLKATIPSDTKAGTGYKIKVVSVSPASESISSSILTIKALSTAAFETKDISIQQYKSADVKLNLTGDLPINLKLSNAQSFDFNEISPTIKLSPNETTEYKITTVSNACGTGVPSTQGLKIIVSQVLATEPNSLVDAFQVFPNPSAELIMVKFKNLENGIQSLELIDSKGIVILKQSITKEEESISLQNIPSGTYYVRWMDGKNLITKKIVKLER